MFGRLFGRFGKGRGEAAHEELPMDRATVGLCFDYGRGVDYSSVYLSDVGLDYILKELKAHGLRGTFNCPAKLCETAPDQLSLIADAGHEIAVLGYADESPGQLSDDELRQLIYDCRSAYTKRGLHPIGFRSPSSDWDDRLCRELARQQFRYDAEHDHAKRLYVIVPGKPPLVRVPVRTDDKGLLRSEKTYNATVSKHLRVVRKAIEQRCFVAVCFHPWILAEDMERMDHWRTWLRTVVKSGANVVAMEDALPPEYRHG